MDKKLEMFIRKIPLVSSLMTTTILNVKMKEVDI